MKLLVVGSGGREHTLVWKLAASDNVARIYCAPGNAGIAELAECVDIDAEDIDSLAAFAREQGIDLTVVGPELPLTLGIVDAFREKGLPIFGPTKKAAELEGSKIFAKEFMDRHRIPTARYRITDDPDRARKILHSGEFPFPVVVKADGLAAGKGVIICEDEVEADAAVQTVRREGKKVGRNEPCPCGSGKKYKKCHGAG